MKQGWKITKLGDVCKISTGNSNTEDAVENGPYAFFDRSKIIKKSNKYLLDCHAIIIAGEGQTFLPKFYSGKFDLHQRAYAIFNFKSNISIYYVYKYLIHFHKYFEEVAVGATAKSLRLRHFQDLPLPYPSLNEQNRIVSFLDKAFVAIDRTKANAMQNLKNAKELFESYLQNVFENKGDDWEEYAFGEICKFVRGPFGGSLKKNIFKNSGFAIYEQQHAIYNQFNEVRYFIDKNKFDEMKRFELLPGDLIMSCSGTMGKIAIVPDNIERGIINQALLKLSPSKNISVFFLKYWMQSDSFQKSLRVYSQGAAIQNVASVKILKNILLQIPDIKEQKIIVQNLDALSAEAKKLETMYKKKIEDLEELKKSILQKAFSGEL